MDIRVSQKPDPGTFRAVALALQSELEGVWTSRIDGLDQRYWDLLVDPHVLTLYLEHSTGIFLDTPAEFPAALLERAAAAVPDQEDWTFRIALSDPFVAGVKDEPAVSLAHDLTEDSNHIHGALELRVHARALPRLGFWGPHDVCLNTWLAELRRAVRQLDEANDATFVFDEGEQGQPLFKFRRNRATLFLSVDDSLVSGAHGDPDWKDVACEYEDFRFHVFRLFGFVRNLLEREIGVSRTNAWLEDIEAA